MAWAQVYYVAEKTHLENNIMVHSACLPFFVDNPWCPFILSLCQSGEGEKGQNTA